MRVYMFLSFFINERMLQEMISYCIMYDLLKVKSPILNPQNCSYISSLYSFHYVARKPTNSIILKFFLFSFVFLVRFPFSSKFSI